jgi:hypothetical protein
VKSKEIEHTEAQEVTDWPGVVARQKNRQKDIEYHLKTKLDADAHGALERLHTRWDGAVVVQADFNPVSSALDDKAMAHFQKPGEVKDYVKRVTERAP